MDSSVQSVDMLLPSTTPCILVNAPRNQWCKFDAKNAGKQKVNAHAYNMNSKSLIWFFMAIGGAIGGYIPMLWGDSFFSFSSVLLTAVGSILGIYVGFKLSH